MHAMPAIVSRQRTQRRCAGDSGNALSLLHQSSPVHYRFLAGGLLAEKRRATPRRAEEGVAPSHRAMVWNRGLQNGKDIHDVRENGFLHHAASHTKSTL